MKAVSCCQQGNLMLPATVCTAAPLIERQPPPVVKPGQKVSAWKMVLIVVLGAAVGALAPRLCGALGLNHLIPFAGPKWMKLWVLGFLPFAWLLCVAVHEFGHLSGGWLSGGRFLLWMVGPLKVQRTPAGIKVRLNKSLNLFGGLAACPPLDPALVSAKRFSVMILAGPLASLLLALVLLGLGRYAEVCGLLRAGNWPLVQHAMIMTGLLSVMICAMTLFPASIGGLRTDGLRAYVLLRGGPRAEQETAMLGIVSMGLAGRRPRELPEALVTGALVLKDHSLFDRYAHLSAFGWAADRGDWERAQACLDHFFEPGETVASYMDASARCDYAWLLATRTPWVATARAWLESAGKLEFDAGTRRRAEAAVLLAEGRAGEAADKAREGLAMMEANSLSPTRNLFMEESLRALLTRAEAVSCPVCK